MCGTSPASFFCAWIFSRPSTVVEKTIFFPPVNCLDTLVKNRLAINGRIYFWTLSFIPLIYVSSFISVPHYTDFRSYVVISEIGKSESYNFVLFQDRFGYDGSLGFPREF